MAMLALVALVAVLAFVAGVADRGNQNLTLYYNPGTESSVCRRQRETAEAQEQAAAEMSAAAYRMRQAAEEQKLAAEAAERAATAKQKEWEAKQELEAKKRQTMIIRIAQAAVGLAGLKVLTAMRQTFIEFQRAQKQAYMSFLREEKKKEEMDKKELDHKAEMYWWKKANSVIEMFTNAICKLVSLAVLVYVACRHFCSSVHNQNHQNAIVDQQGRLALPY